MANLEKRLQEIVGAEFFFNDQELTRAYSRDESIFTGVIPSFIVRPATADEIRDLVRLANKEKLPLIPLSSGIHFNGSTLPVEGGCMVDLSRMDRIIEVDIRNRRAMIEPGVRWNQLRRHLAEMDMVAMNPLFPHSAQSVLSSYLERQPLLIPKFEYAEPIGTLEVILPTGDLLRTGSAASPGAPFDTVADMVCPYGPGLDFYRLFQGAQGSLGIITWANVKIEYLSPLRKTYFIQSADINKLLDFIHQVQRLMIGNECFILKKQDFAAIAGFGNPQTAAAISGEIAPYTVVIQIAGTRRRPQERIDYQDKALREICAQFNFDPSEFCSALKAESEVFNNLIKGEWPRDKTYWRYSQQGQCHDIPFHTTINRLPGIIEDINEYLAENGVNENGFGIYIQPLENGRAYYCRYHLYYDPENPDHKITITNLDREINRRLFLVGTLFNTPSQSQAKVTYSNASMTTDVLKKVKGIFDPRGIMNPGKLCF